MGVFPSQLPLFYGSGQNDRHQFRSIVHLKTQKTQGSLINKRFAAADIFKSPGFAKKGNGCWCHAQWKNRAVQRMPKSLHDNFIECYSRFKTAARSTIENSWLLIQMGINIVQYPFMKSAAIMAEN